MTLRLQLEGTVVVYRTRSVAIHWSAQLSTDNIVRYNISIEKKRSDFNKGRERGIIIYNIYFSCSCEYVVLFTFVNEIFFICWFVIVTNDKEKKNAPFYCTPQPYYWSRLINKFFNNKRGKKRKYIRPNVAQARIGEEFKVRKKLVGGYWEVIMKAYVCCQLS